MTLQTLEARWTPAAAGTLDPTFGAGGFAQFAPPPGSSGFIPAAVVAYPDGRYVVSGASTGSQSLNGNANYLARYTAAGQLDTTFGRAGFATLPNSVGIPTALAVDPFGRVVFNSAFAAGGLTIGRVTADGRLDAGFGTNGVATIPVSPTVAQSVTVSALAFQPDGRIVVAGAETVAVSLTRLIPASIVVGRFTDAGQLDASFGAGGVVTVSFPLNDQNRAYGNAVAVLPDGRIVVAGGAYASVTINSFLHLTSPSSDAVVVRLNAAGQLDPSFGSGGRVSLSTPGVDDQAAGVRVLADGRVLVVGNASQTQKAFAARLTADGSPDTTYGGNGRVDVSGSTDVLPVADGRALLVTYTSTFSLPSSTTLGRLTTTGQPEPGFGTAVNDGIRFDYFSPSRAVALSDGGLLLLAGVPSQSDQVAVHFIGSTTLFPAPVGTLSLGGTPDGSVTPLLPDADGTFARAAALNIYPNFPGSVRTATADVNGDGVPDVITGPGPGGGPNVVVTDGKTGAVLANLDAFETTFTGGVFVAAADVNGDGKAEVVVTPDQGGGPVVAIYDGAALAAGKNNAGELVRFLGIDDAAFRGGARPALGDVNGDGAADLVVAAGFGGGPRVAVYDGPRTADRSRWDFAGRGGPKGLGQAIFLPPKLVGDFFVFEPTLRNGVFVAAGDLNGDGKAEVVFGGGPGGGPRVLAFDGAALMAGQQTTVVNIFAGDPGGRGGVRVAVRTAPDGAARLVTGSGEGQPGRVGVYKAATALAGGLAADQVVSPFGDAVLVDGVFVG